MPIGDPLISTIYRNIHAMLSSCILTQAFRFTGYIGVSVASLVVPILVYRISGSSFLAGLAMMAEWLPKLLMYILGGAMIQQASPRRAFLCIEGLRALSMGLLLYAAFEADAIVLIVFAAAVLQCCNAGSNLLFESAVTRWWPTAQRAAGHAQLLRLDLTAGVLMPPLLSWLPLPVLIAAGAAAFGANWIGGLLLANRIFASVRHPTLSPTLLLAHARRNFGMIFANKPLRGLIFLSITVALPACLVAAQLPIFLGTIDAGLSSDTAFQAAFGAVRAMSAVALLSLTERWLLAGRSQFHVLWTGLLLSAIGIGGMLLMRDWTGYSFSILILGLGFYLYTVFARERRQEFISDQDRLSCTGLLISVESLSFVFGAALLALCATRLDLVLLTSAGLILGALVYAKRCGTLDSRASEQAENRASLIMDHASGTNNL